MHLKQWGKEPVVTWLGDEARAPDDAQASLQRARAAGVRSRPTARALGLRLDALLGIGSTRAPAGVLARQIELLNAGAAPVLAVDLPSGLDAATGQASLVVRAAHTLSLLALKPGLFTGLGRDAAGTVWFDDLQVAANGQAPSAWLSAFPPARPRPHASHKGSHGDVAVIGGAPGMAGAALLAARAALHQGPGRVFVGFLDPSAPALDPLQPT
jgi:hypothetical protein